MNGLTLKTRLLSGAALGAGLVFLASAPAQAACTVAAGVVTCATTTTTDTTNVGGTPASDRNYPVDTSAVPFTGTVSSGAVVDGFGLAFSNTFGGTNALNVVNNGTVQINAGNTATAGGNSALQVTAIGATPVNYSGGGSIINLSTTGDGLAMRSSGTGNLTAVVGGNVTSVGGSAILGIQSGTAGDISIGTAAGTTLLAKSNGIIAIVTNPASAGTITIVNNAAILSPTGSPNTLATGIFALTNGTGAVTVTNVGAIGSATDRVGTGISAIAKGGPLSVSGTGAIFSNGTGILATNSGTGTISINYTGPINVTGAATTGILSIAGTGATTITTGAVTAGIDAILALSSGGTQTINANGVTTGTTGAGISSSTTGARTINVGAAGNVTGGTQAILLNGSGITTINNSGIIGGAATGLAVSAPGPSSTTVNNLAGATLNGRLTLGAGADALVNSGTFNTQGTTDFGAGVDVLTNNASGIINILGATSFTGLETFTQNGRINLNANTLTLSGTPFVNGATGFIDTSGSASILGITSFSNAGTLDLAAGTFTVPAVAFTNSGTILADEGASTLTGQTSFANSGTIDLQDGVVGDTLTINSAFVGSGLSSLLVDFTAFTSDLLVINGAASGTTTIGAAYLGGGLNLDGVLVVDATSASANAFVLGAVTGETPLLEVSLVQSGGDFFLVTAPTAAAFTPLVVPGFAADLWYQSADEIFAETVKPASTVGASVWGEVYASRDRVGDKTDGVSVDGFEFTVDNQLKTKRYGAQLGVDYGFGAGRIGLTGGYAWADANGEADLKAEGWNVGVYGQFGGLTGFHGEFLVKHDRYNAEFNGGAFSGEEFDIRSTGADGSLGFRFGFGEATTIDLHAGVSHVRTKVDDINAFGFNYDIGNFTSTRGRAGVRAIFGGGLAPYLGATVYREFNRDRDIEFFDGVNSYDVGNDGRGTYVRLEGGLSGNNGPGPILAAWIDILDRSGVGLRAGWRFGGRVAEVLPPPPPPVIAPPPPPPPPATQTCPDGSLILATDVCPPPPPPPPPAPEPERG